MANNTDLYFFIQHQYGSFENAVKEIKLVGIKPVPADNLDIMFQHILFSYSNPKDFRNDFPEYEDDSVVAIKILPSVIEKFSKGSLETYGQNKEKKTYLRMLDKEDIFPVTDCEFSEV